MIDKFELKSIVCMFDDDTIFSIATNLGTTASCLFLKYHDGFPYALLNKHIQMQQRGMGSAMGGRGLVSLRSLYRLGEAGGEARWFGTEKG
jgi:hypothetical protein